MDRSIYEARCCSLPCSGFVSASSPSAPFSDEGATMAAINNNGGSRHVRAHETLGVAQEIRAV